jgi:hypothetical protein
MEVSPRAGGNRLAEMLNVAADVDIIDAEVVKAVGEKPVGIHEPNYKGHYAIYVLHSDKCGLYQGIEVEENFKKEHVVEEEIRIQKGAHIEPFTGANTAIGTLFLRFSSHEEMMDLMKRRKEWIRIVSV